MSLVGDKPKRRETLESIDEIFAGFDPNTFFAYYGSAFNAAQQIFDEVQVDNWTFRPIEYAVWKVTLENDPIGYRRIWNMPFEKGNALLFGEFFWITAIRRSNIVLLTLGPPESGKSTLNASLAHYMRDMMILFSRGNIVPRIYLTYDFSDTSDTLANPEIARERMMPVSSLIPPFRQFDITEKDIKNMDDDVVIPQAGDIILQDEVSKQTGLGSGTAMEAIKNILKAIRVTQISFLFATPKELRGLPLNMALEPVARDFKNYATWAVLYDGYYHPVARVAVMVYPDIPFFKVYEKRKKQYVEDLVAGGGISSAISPEKINADIKRVAEYMQKNNDYPMSLDGLVLIMQKAKIQGPLSYLRMLAKTIWDAKKDVLIELARQYGTEVGAFNDMIAPTAVEDEDLSTEEETDSTDEQDEEDINNESDTEESDEEIENFEYYDVAYELLLNEQMIEPTNADWRAVQMAFYYTQLYGVPIAQAKRNIDRLAKEYGFKTISEKTIRTYVRGETDYFKQIERSLVTKIGFKYEEFTHRWWQKHEEVKRAIRYEKEGKHHQGTADIILETVNGYKIAVACKVRARRKGYPIIVNFDETPEWKAFINGEVDAVILDVYDTTEGEIYRRFILPYEMTGTRNVRWDININGEPASAKITDLEKNVEKIKQLMAKERQIEEEQKEEPQQSQ